MESKGRITQLNLDIGYGFVTVPKLGNVFFSEKSSITGLKFRDLKVDDVVLISVAETERGLFAEAMSLAKPRPSERPAEVGL